MGDYVLKTELSEEIIKRIKEAGFEYLIEDFKHVVETNKNLEAYEKTRIERLIPIYNKFKREESKPIITISPEDKDFISDLEMMIKEAENKKCIDMSLHEDYKPFMVSKIKEMIAHLRKNEILNVNLDQRESLVRLSRILIYPLAGIEAQETMNYIMCNNEMNKN